MALNWAMISQDGRSLVPLPGEKVFFSQEKTSVALDMGGGYPGNPGGIYKGEGIIYVTNQRAVFVSRPAVAHFKSLSIPLMNLREGKLQQPWFGANYYQALVHPVEGGGMPCPGGLKITFKEGGGFEFSTIFNEVKNRLYESEGHAPPDTIEPLPLYTPRAESQSADPTSTTAPSGSSLAGAASPAIIPYTIPTPEVHPAPPNDTPSETNREITNPFLNPIYFGGDSNMAEPDDLPPSYDDIDK
ncbi:4142_t:CDS:2 [Paraglomus brasilianum]|uniref:4142_t:CDS:1 n=1 Tax=Paraglomus brasilianum TaxID=144538 RepID=A0A9N9C336_9GLOM|nr:4142_t:CDS:2 [Paraglomus brasilianum]